VSAVQRAAPAPTSDGPAAPDGLIQAMPIVFVLIWSTGFVVARFGMPHAPPMGFLAWRYGLSLVAFGLWVAWARAAWPQGRAAWGHLAVTGVLMQAGYLGFVWTAVKAGIGAGTVALVVGLQPVLTALWVSARGSEQRISARRWLGLALGLAGLVLVVWRKLGVGEAGWFSLVLAVAALASITVGTLYQKRFVAPCDVRSASFVQMLAALAVTLPLALLETERVHWHPHMIGAMAWSVGVLTLGGSSLLYLLIQRGAATRVTSLMYLVPPCTAVLAWALFDELLGWPVLVGLLLTALGVWLAAASPAARGAPTIEGKP
jgi:drug/metabolite transporter (DMT)-like permease